MGGKDKHIVSVLEHARYEPQREHMVNHTEVAQHYVAAPTPHDTKLGCVDISYEEVYVPNVPQQTHTDISGCETHLGDDAIGGGVESIDGNYRVITLFSLW